MTASVSQSTSAEEVQMLRHMLQLSLQRLIDEESIGKVFHDFNNILSSSMGYSSLALERARNSGDEKLARYLDNIERAGIRARDLVRERLQARQTLRDSEQLDWAGLCAMLHVSNVPASGADVHVSTSLLDYACRRIRCHARLASVQAEVHEEAQCQACRAELRGRQLRLTLLTEAEPSADMAEDMPLLRAIIDSCGGHFCESLVQARQIVVYLRAVVPDVARDADK